MEATRVDGRYELGGELGRGESATVHRARDLASGREVALKLAARPESEAGERLRREFEHLARLEHPNLARVHEFGTTREEGRCYFTLDLIEGASLEAAAGDLDPAELARLLAQCLGLLAFFERRGLVHGDLKPANLMVVRGERGAPLLRVIDLGLAGEPGAGPRGLIRGTPRYAAPSILEGEAPTAHTDLYALGASFLCVSGRWEGSAAQPRALDPGLAAVLERLVARDPDTRYQSAQDALADLLALGVQEEALATGAFFVGRQRELARLRGRVEELRAGEATRHVVCVLGEAGSGKSALLEQWRRSCELAAVVVVPARAVPEGQAPLAVWRQVARHLALLATGGQPTLPEEPELGEVGLGAAERAELLCRHFEAHACERPLLVLIEDAQWLDEASLAVLEELARAHGRGRWLIGLAAREEPSEASVALRRLARSAALERVQLGGLSDEETATLLAVLAPGLERDVRERIAGAAGGRPALVHAAARAVLQRPGTAIERAIEEGLAALVADELQQEIERMTPREREAATRLAVLSLPVDLAFAAELCELPPEEAGEVCAALGRQGLFDERSSGSLQIQSAALAAALREHAGEPVRRALHARALAVWERRAPRGARAELAPAFLHHALGAEDLEAVLRHAPEALQRLIGGGMPRAARESLDAVLGLLERRSLAPNAALLELDGDLLRHAGELVAARERYERALDATPLDASRRVGLACKRARALEALGEYERSRAILEEALAAVDDPVETARLQAALSVVCYRLGDPVRAEDCLRLGLEALGEDSLDAEAASLWNNLGVLAYERSDHQQARRSWRRALSIYEACGDRARMGKALTNLGSVAMVAGELEEARRAYEQAGAIKERLGDRRSLAATMSNLAMLEHWQGGFGRSIQLDEQVLRLREQMGDAAGAAHTHASLAMVWLDKGELGRAFHHARRASNVARETRERDATLSVALLAEASVEAVVGRRRQALEAVAAALEGARRVSNRALEARCLGLLATLSPAEAAQDDLELLRAVDEPRGLGLGLLAAAEALLERDEEAGVDELLREAGAIAARLGLPHLEARVLCGRGRLERRRGAYESASMALQRALDLSRDLGTPELEWQVCRELALYHRQQGQLVRAVGLLDGCVAVFRRVLATLEGQRELEQAYLSEPTRTAVLDLLEAWIDA